METLCMARMGPFNLGWHLVVMHAMLVVIVLAIRSKVNVVHGQLLFLTTHSEQHQAPL